MGWWGDLGVLHGPVGIVESVSGEVVVGGHLPAGIVFRAELALLALHCGLLGLLGLALPLENGCPAFSCHG